MPATKRPAATRITVSRNDGPLGPFMPPPHLDRVVVGTGIANIHFRMPSAAATGGRILDALHPRGFVLGLGVSHGPFVEQSLGGEYRKPLAMMRS